jgi:hypothetical protein
MEGTIPSTEKDTDSSPVFVLPKTWFTLSAMLNPSKARNNLSRDE